MRRDDDGPVWEQSMDPEFDMYDALVELHGVTERKAEHLADEYPNLPTLSWATWHDTEYVQDEVQINPSYLRDQLYDADLYASYQSFPDRVIRPDREDDLPQPDDTEDRRSPFQYRLSDYHDDSR